MNIFYQYMIYVLQSTEFGILLSKAIILTSAEKIITRVYS